MFQVVVDWEKPKRPITRKFYEISSLSLILSFEGQTSVDIILSAVYSVAVDGNTLHAINDKNTIGHWVFVNDTKDGIYPVDGMG